MPIWPIPSQCPSKCRWWLRQWLRQSSRGGASAAVTLLLAVVEVVVVVAEAIPMPRGWSPYIHRFSQVSWIFHPVDENHTWMALHRATSTTKNLARFEGGVSHRNSGCYMFKTSAIVSSGFFMYGAGGLKPGSRLAISAWHFLYSR